MMSRLQPYMRFASARLNDAWARKRGEKSHLLYIAEFPRSGGNWTRDLVGDILQLPVPRMSLFPISFPAVVQTHSEKPFAGPKTIYVVRDGRDVLVSHYYKAVNSVLGPSPVIAARTRKFHASLRTASPEAMRAGDCLEAFYEEWCVRAVGSHGSWGDHVAAWTAPGQPNRTVIRYEDLHSTPSETLKTALSDLGYPPPDDFLVDFAIQRNSFAQKTGRAPGDVDNASNRRSGKPGGWRATLPNSLAARFEADFGPVLSQMGYGTGTSQSSV